jgi:3-deoxy-D-manno-octulosonic-acid transferase
MIADAHRLIREKVPGALTVVVPRHPERGNAVREVLAARRLSVAQRSRGEPLLREIDVYLADTLGELGLFYRSAPIAFLGGSLVPHGGQNPIEPVKLETAVLHGPHVSTRPRRHPRFPMRGRWPMRSCRCSARRARRPISPLLRPAR